MRIGGGGGFGFVCGDEFGVWIGPMDVDLGWGRLRLGAAVVTSGDEGVTFSGTTGILGVDFDLWLFCWYCCWFIPCCWASCCWYCANLAEVGVGIVTVLDVTSEGVNEGGRSSSSDIRIPSLRLPFPLTLASPWT